MPTLRIDTNVSKSKIDLDGFSNDLTKAIAESLNKPIGYVLVIIHPDVAMTYGEGEGKNPDWCKSIFTSENSGFFCKTDRKKPAAFATLLSIGQLGLEENKKHSANIQPLIKKYLGVEPTRCFIYFNVSFFLKKENPSWILI